VQHLVAGHGPAGSVCVCPKLVAMATALQLSATTGLRGAGFGTCMCDCVCVALFYLTDIWESLLSQGFLKGGPT